MRKELPNTEKCKYVHADVRGRPPRKLEALAAEAVLELYCRKMCCSKRWGGGVRVPGTLLSSKNVALRGFAVFTPLYFA